MTWDKKKSRIGLWNCHVTPNGAPIRDANYLMEIIIYCIPVFIMWLIFFKNLQNRLDSRKTLFNKNSSKKKKISECPIRHFSIKSIWGWNNTGKCFGHMTVTVTEKAVQIVIYLFINLQSSFLSSFEYKYRTIWAGAREVKLLHWGVGYPSSNPERGCLIWYWVKYESSCSPFRYE